MSQNKISWCHHQQQIKLERAYFICLWQSCQRHSGVIVWNSILTNGIPVDVVKQFSSKHWNALSLKANYKESYSWKTPMSLISHYIVAIFHRNDSENPCIQIITALYSERNLEMLLTETELSNIAFLPAALVGYYRHIKKQTRSY